jgi:hypothetical protein
MKMPLHALLIVAAAAVAVWNGVGLGADLSSVTKTPAAPLVGDLGRKEALLLEGNKTFTREQILEALRWHLEFQIASHRLAPLSDYIAVLERKIVLGYQRAGFPEVTAKATGDVKAGRILLRVSEGPRYRCGDVLLSGFKTMTNEVVRQKIMDAIRGIEPGQSAQQTNLNSTLWNRNRPVPFDDLSRGQLTTLIQGALEELDYYQPAVNFRIAPDPAHHLADLKIEIADEGIKGTIEEFEVTGLRTNTQPQLLEYLKLKRGIYFGLQDQTARIKIMRFELQPGYGHLRLSDTWPRPAEIDPRYPVGMVCCWLYILDITGKASDFVGAPVVLQVSFLLEFEHPE